MKLDSKTALGIDIADKAINVALLKRNKNGVELIKTASGPVPEGALKNGNVEDPALLARAIRALVSRSHIRVRLRQAAVSLAARPVLLQIMEVPKQVPTSIGQFVHNEVKHCVALSGKRIALDFCGIGSGGRAGSDRLLVVAADNRNVAQIVKTCNLARVNIEAIEPPVLAYARAFYAKKIAGKFDCKVLLAAISGGTLTLCVFKRQAVDFVRTRDINGQISEPSALCQRVASEIKAIIQFYDSAPDSDQGDQAEGLDRIKPSFGGLDRIKPAFGGPAKWEITVIADRVQLPEDAEELLKAKLTESSLQVRCPEDACQDTSVVRDPTSREPRDSARLGKGPRLRGGKLAPEKSGASVAAIGLAMKLLGPDASNLRINLLPPEAAEVKAFKRHALITANVIAVVLFGMVLAIGGLMLMIEKTSENIVREKQGQSLQDTSALLMEERMLDKQIKQLSDGPGQLNEILSSHRDGDWLGILSDLRSRVPKAVCIRDLKSSGNSKIFLEGLALSYESVHLFVNMLDQSQYVDSASLIEAEKDSKEGGLVRYAISCQLRAAEGK